MENIFYFNRIKMLDLKIFFQKCYLKSNKKIEKANSYSEGLLSK